MAQLVQEPKVWTEQLRQELGITHQERHLPRIAGSMNQAFHSLVAAAVMLLAYSVPTEAQEKPLHGWGLLGLGTGSANVACDGDRCPSGWKLHGPTLMIAAGVMFTPHLGIGLGLDQWWRGPADTEATNTGTVFLRYRPSVRAGAFIESGVGLSRVGVRLDGDTIAQGRRWAVMAAVGYDVRLVRLKDADITLTPRASYVYSSIGDLNYAAGMPPFATGWRHQVLSVGLGVGFSGPTARQ